MSMALVVLVVQIIIMVLQAVLTYLQGQVTKQNAVLVERMEKIAKQTSVT